MNTTVNRNMIEVGVMCHGRTCLRGSKHDSLKIRTDVIVSCLENDGKV